MFYTYAGGFLASLGWQYSFLAYLIGIPVLFCVVILFPRDIKAGVKDKNTENPAANIHEKISPELFFLAGISMIYIILYFAYTNNISLFVSNTGLGTSAESGISYSIVNGCGFLGGLMFGNISKKLKYHMFWTASLITAAGFFIICSSYQLLPLYLGSIFLGIGLSWFLPQCNLRIAEIVPGDRLSFAYGLNSAISNLGQFLSVLVINGVAGIIGLTSIREIFILAFWGNIAVTIIYFLYVKIRCRRRSA